MSRTQRGGVWCPPACGKGGDFCWRPCLGRLQAPGVAGGGCSGVSQSVCHSSAPAIAVSSGCAGVGAAHGTPATPPRSGAGQPPAAEAEEQSATLWGIHIKMLVSWHQPAPASSLAAAGGGPGAGAVGRAPPSCWELPSQQEFRDLLLVPPAQLPRLVPASTPSCAGEQQSPWAGSCHPARSDIPAAPPSSSVPPAPQAWAPGRAPLPQASSWQTGPAGIFPCPGNVGAGKPCAGSQGAAGAIRAGGRDNSRMARAAQGSPGTRVLAQRGRGGGGGLITAPFVWAAGGEVKL